MGVKKKAWEVANAARKSAVNEAWRKAHPERLKAHRLKAVYGITEEEYDRLLAEQGGVCAICGEPETVDAVNQHGTTLSRLCVDHNHETGQIRGLLCRRCNLGLGHLGEDVARLRSAITYLEDR